MKHYTVLFLFLAVFLSFPPATHSLAVPQTLAGTWGAASLFASPQALHEGTGVDADGALQLQEGSLWGSYLSPIHRSDFPFNAVGVRWQARFPEGTDLLLEVRASEDGSRWTPWMPVGTVDGLSEGDEGAFCSAESTGGDDGAQGRSLREAPIPFSDLLIFSGRFLQYRATLTAQEVGTSPRIEEIALIYLNTLKGPKAPRPGGNALPSGRGVGLTRPVIISRAGWGADESYRYSGGEEIWPPQYRPWVKAVIHHTGTSNAETDPAATVRAIYYYHAVELGWGDIGYNFLADRYGNVYEGRYGGENVTGGHVLWYNSGSIGVAALGTYGATGISEALREALVRLLTWEASTHAIHPTASGFFVDKDLPNVMGHRDALQTTCPGDALYGTIPALRASVWQRYPDYGQAWIEHNTPTALLTGQTVTVTLTIGNGGKRTWTAVQRPIYRLGYHWYDASGRQYVQPPEEDHRTALPRDLTTGEATTLQARLTAPRVPGIYTLKWDMVQEGVTWFAGTGAPTLDITIAVAERRYGVAWGTHTTPTTLRPGETTGVRVTLRNTGNLVWRVGGANPFHLGYHWYDAQGRQYVQPPAEDHRSELPQDVALGEQVTVNALLTAPWTPGTYTLKWDMVQEGITWFANQGSPTLDVTTQVLHPTPTPTPTPTVPSLSIRLGHGSALVEAGTVVTYLVVYTNLGATATGVVVTQEVGSNLTYLESVPPLASQGNQRFSRTLGTLTGGTALSNTLVVRVAPGLTPGTAVAVTATIGHDGLRGPEYDPSDDTAVALSRVLLGRAFVPLVSSEGASGW